MAWSSGLTPELSDSRRARLPPATKPPNKQRRLNCKAGRLFAPVTWLGATKGKRQMEKRDNLNFGEAIEALKRGQRVTRPNWNGKGMYLWLLPAAKVKAEWCREPHLKAVAEANGGEIEALGSIRMMTADKKVLTGWLASQTDMLAEDWQIIEE